jgi:hypothetical protein
VTPQEFAASIENLTRKLIERRDSHLRATASDEFISIIMGQSTMKLAREDMRLPEVVDKIVTSAADDLGRYVGARAQEAFSLHEKRLSMFAENADDELQNLVRSENEALKTVTDTNDRIQALTAKMNRWSTLMNVRTTVWYLYLTVGLFLLALVTSCEFLVTGKPLIRLFAA